MKYQQRKIGMTLVEAIILLVVFLFLSISIFPAFLMAIKLNMVSLEANITDVSAQQQIESLYSYSATGKLTDALVMLNKSYEIVTDGNSITLTKSDSMTNTIIILERDKPAGGMTSTKITVSLINNEKQLPPSHIETILVFQ